jgi:hypothetical protein
MRLLIDQVANGFIVTRSNIAMDTQESHVFESIDALCKHLRDVFVRADRDAELSLNVATNPYAGMTPQFTAAMPRPPVLD